MVEEIPIEDTGGTGSISDTLEAPETQPECEAEPKSQNTQEERTQPEPKKRGRPKKETPKPPEPKRKPGRPKKEPPQETPQERIAPQERPEIDPFRATLDTMSSAALVAELVNRRRASERQMKQELYRSFVM
jgi:outer membrane biosynthesis protein TonB